MSRRALRLAALASSAVPGLDPVSVEAVPSEVGDLYEFAFVTDSQDRRWVIKAARTPAAGAQLEDVSTLMTLLAGRLEVGLPMVRGVASASTGRAVVHPRVPGQSLDFAALPPGAPLTAEVGRTLAHIHNLDLLVFEEAGRPSYDSETHRKRMLSELDRASATGHVPTGLLSRWEHRLENVSLWRFAPTPVHGGYTGSHVLAQFDDESDAGSGRIRGVIGWEQARVGDPADDLAELVARAHPTALDTVLEAYVQTRIERPDSNLLRRARLAAEMSVVHRLLRALSAGETRLVEQLSTELRELDERIQDAEQRAEARRLRAERRAREERQRAQAEAAAAIAADRPAVDEATQPYSPPTPGTVEGTSRPTPPAAYADEATQPYTPPTPPTADALTQPVTSMPTDEDAPSRAPESWQLATAVDPDGLFEVDAVEPLPTGAVSGEGQLADAPPPAQASGPPDGMRSLQDESSAEGEVVDDQHEGASDFVSIDPHPEGREHERS